MGILGAHTGTIGCIGLSCFIWLVKGQLPVTLMIGAIYWMVLCCTAPLSQAKMTAVVLPNSPEQS